MNTLLRWFCMLALSLGSVSIDAAPAAPQPAKPIPEPLKDWETWATWNEQHRLCPSPAKDSTQHYCTWSSRLSLAIEAQDGRFELGATVYHPTWVALPGSSELWPQTVKVDGTAVAVIERENKPAVWLQPGTHRLTGTYRWSKQPQQFHLPAEIGILTLSVDGKAVEAPSWNADGKLWLKRDAATETAEGEFLTVKLSSLLGDGVPLYLNTEVELKVAGKSREVELGAVLPLGWKILSVESPLPATIDELGRMRAQIRAGTWTVRIRAFRLDQPKTFAYGADAKPAAPEQLIGFLANPTLRTVAITGAEPVDATQVKVPAEWQSMPIYRWRTSVPFGIEEHMRGMGDKKAAGLHITRRWWLDEDGKGITYQDSIKGTAPSDGRLDAAAGQELGAVRTLSSTPTTTGGLLLTLNPATKSPGVEIRTREVDLQGVGRFAVAPSLTATGWQVDTDALEVSLNLPPGWRLFALSGADWVYGDWLTAWTMFDLFLLLLLTLAVFRFWGLKAALLAFVGFAISYHEPNAPRFLWLLLLLPAGLLRVVPEGCARQWIAGIKWLAACALVLALVPFVAAQIQRAIYPQLESTAAYSPSAPLFMASEKAPAYASAAASSFRLTQQELTD